MVSWSSDFIFRVSLLRDIFCSQFNSKLLSNNEAKSQIFPADDLIHPYIAWLVGVIINYQVT